MTKTYYTIFILIVWIVDSRECLQTECVPNDKCLRKCCDKDSMFSGVLGGKCTKVNQFLIHPIVNRSKLNVSYKKSCNSTFEDPFLINEKDYSYLENGSIIWKTVRSHPMFSVNRYCFEFFNTTPGVLVCVNKELTDGNVKHRLITKIGKIARRLFKL